MGLEPILTAWKAIDLPLIDTRFFYYTLFLQGIPSKKKKEKFFFFFFYVLFYFVKKNIKKESKTSI